MPAGFLMNDNVERFDHDFGFVVSVIPGDSDSRFVDSFGCGFLQSDLAKFGNDFFVGHEVDLGLDHGVLDVTH